ncbi:MAG: glycosyltransferase family 2 protein [Candidatus Pelagibacter sp.]
MDLVSIIIPYFKKREYIFGTINSVLRQSYKNFEIIIIYDDQDKGDLSFIKKLTKLDKRISLIINKKSLGAGLSRNNGIKRCKGKYIGFIDADDMWKKNKLELQIKFMKKKNCSISHTNYEIIDKKNNILDHRIARDFNTINDLIKSCDIGLSSVIVKKELLVKECLFANLKTKEDFVLWLNILKNNVKISALQKNLMYWRKLDNSLSSSIIQKIRDGYCVYNKFMKFNVLKSLFFLFLLSFNSLLK